MTMRAELHDGRTLEFPDGTDPAVIQGTVKRMLGVSADPAALAKEAAASLPYKMGQAGAQPAQGLGSYAAQSLIEGAPSTAGAIMGAPFGIPSMTAGAAFGETLRQTAKSLTHPSVMPGVKTPVNTDPILTTAALTAAIPSVLVGGSKLVGNLKDKFVTPVMDLFKEGGEKDLATKYLKEKVLGEKTLPAVMEAARNVKEYIPGEKPTMAQAVGGIPEGSPIQAHQQVIAKSPKDVSAAFGEREAKQRVAEEIAQRYATTMTWPKGAEALSRANEGGAITNEIAKRRQVIQALIDKNKDILRNPSVTRTVTGTSDDMLKSAMDIHAPYAPQTLLSQKELATGQHALENIEKGQAARRTAAENIPPLKATKNALGMVQPPFVDAKSILGEVNKLYTPEAAGSELSTTALNKVTKRLEAMANKQGVIDARSLYQFKKEGLDEVVNKAFGKENIGAGEKFKAKNLIQVKNSIDDAIDQGGGTGWKEYLKEYEGRMANITQALTRRESQYKPLQKTDLAEPEIDKLQIANVLDRPVSYANALIRHLKGDIKPRIKSEFEHMYLDPKYFVQQMEHVPLRYRPMVEALLRQAGGVTGAQMGAQIAHTP